MNRLFPICLAFLTICAGAGAQENLAQASPEMARLAKALAGDWNTTETMERGEFFPKGGSRTGHSHVALAAGGIRWSQRFTPTVRRASSTDL